jgi:hypothetical protein
MACLGVATIAKPMTGPIRIANKLEQNKRKNLDYILNETLLEFNKKPKITKKSNISATTLIKNLQKQKAEQEEIKNIAALADFAHRRRGTNMIKAILSSPTNQDFFDFATQLFQNPDFVKGMLSKEPTIKTDEENAAFEARAESNAAILSKLLGQKPELLNMISHNFNTNAHPPMETRKKSWCPIL